MRRVVKLASIFIGLWMVASTTTVPVAQTERIWLGPDWWANRLQDWRIETGKILSRSGQNRTAFILTYRLSDRNLPFSMNTKLSLSGKDLNGKAGFRLGIHGLFDDYRDDAVYGKGIDAGVDTGGNLFIGEKSKPLPWLRWALREGVKIGVKGRPEGENTRLCVEALWGEKRDKFCLLLPSSRLEGGIALLSHLEGDAGGWRFSPPELAGERISYRADHRFGPVLFILYTLSDGMLKLTAQMPPVGREDGRAVYIEVKEKEGWKRIDSATIHPLSRTATFRIENWDGSADHRIRVCYPYLWKGRERKLDCLEGLVKKEPSGKEEFVLAAFTGNGPLGFPHKELVSSVAKHNPDLLFFSGDQIYERAGGFGYQMQPLKEAMLDYLRKWYLFGWAFGDLLRTTPSVVIPDDHDVFHGNLWGCGGKPADRSRGTKVDWQDSGGYIMPPVWIRAVERTQTSHLPDPYDPEPVKQGIGVYYTHLRYGGISFAVIEDRKFKSAPKPLLPEADIRNGWPRNPNFDPKTQADPPGAVLLGERQLHFLREWVTDWSGDVWMKVVLSQTIFANFTTIPADAANDDVVPSIKIPGPGEYIKGDKLSYDMDSNGWPPSGRNRALRIIRKAFAVHIGGDQHLGATLRYGIDSFRDASIAFSAPSISNIWPRHWFPPHPGANRKPGSPPYTGDFYDGFGNRMTVYAVANPRKTGLEPAVLYDRAPGYGIIRFHRRTRKVTFECWPRQVDPEKGKPYEGWPVIAHQYSNYGAKIKGYLPYFKVRSSSPALFLVYDERTSELVYALRPAENPFAPFVFENSIYRVKICDPDRRICRTFNHLKPEGKPFTLIEVKLESHLKGALNSN